jgi:hypothetical protein
MAALSLCTVLADSRLPARVSITLSKSRIRVSSQKGLSIKHAVR